MVSAFIAVMKVVVKVNRTLTSLEGAVNRLNECIGTQTLKNEKIFEQLSLHELRITLLEKKRNSKKGDKNEN